MLAVATPGTCAAAISAGTRVPASPDVRHAATPHASRRNRLLERFTERPVHRIDSAEKREIDFARVVVHGPAHLVRRDIVELAEKRVEVLPATTQQLPVPQNTRDILGCLHVREQSGL